MLLDLLWIALGVAVLTWAAGRFVAGASSLATNLGVSPLIVGLIVVGFGTSAPELLVSATAALRGAGSLGVGNAIGSNITNVGLILGVTALVSPLTVRSETLRRELPLLLGAMLLALLLVSDLELGRADGIVLLAALLAAVVWLGWIAVRTRGCDPIVAEVVGELRQPMRTGAAIAWTAVGLALLLASSNLLVLGATGIARALGIDELVIGLTIVAVGTSLPEFAASLAGALRKEDDIAIGNVIGSNVFNVLGVLGLPGALAPAAVSPTVVYRDFPVMIGFTLAFFACVRWLRRPGQLGRVDGALLLAGFLAYEVWVYVDAPL